MGYRDNNLLFQKGDLTSVLKDHYGQVHEKVDAIPRDQFLATREDELVEHITSLLMLEPIELHEHAMTMEQHETKVDVTRNYERNPFRDRGPIIIPGIRVTISIPFTGDKAFWHINTNPFQGFYPRAVIRPPSAEGVGCIDIVIEQPSDDNPEKIKQTLESNLKAIRPNLSQQKTEIERQNAELPKRIREAIIKRRDRLKAHENIAAILDIPLRRKAGVPEIRPIPIKRKLVKPLPPPPKSGFKPEPGISSEDYEHILSVIRHEGRSFEATPKTFAIHDEEELRDIVLAHLNGHYQGGATGETFRGNGKTDIRIEDKDRAAFVAECKVWGGPNTLLNAIDQLLGYLTWRDCKASIILFNKHNAKFSELLEKVQGACIKHPGCKKDLSEQNAGEWRYVFISDEDEMRYVQIHVFLFNLYVKPTG